MADGQWQNNDFSFETDQMSGTSLKITVLAGGPSREREVSQASGACVAAGLSAAGYKVELADISSDNLVALENGSDVFFPALHGEFGEDGQLQQLMEDRGLVYCGTGSEACRVSSDKCASKKLFLENDLPTAAFDFAAHRDDVHRAGSCWSMPVVVKPVAEGSSIGITIVREADTLRDVVGKTLEEFGPVMVEQYLGGRELTVGILGGRALPVIEIRPDGEFYDYFAKYDSDATQYVFDIDIREDFYRSIQEQSVLAARVLGMRDFCRVDWVLDDADSPFLLEVNAIPGFTDHSLLPKAARHAGLDMPSLCGRIVEMTVARTRGHASETRS